jgi:hypothetical protein
VRLYHPVSDDRDVIPGGAMGRFNAIALSSDVETGSPDDDRIREAGRTRDVDASPRRGGRRRRAEVVAAAVAVVLGLLLAGAPPAGAADAVTPATVVAASGGEPATAAPARTRPAAKATRPRKAADPVVTGSLGPPPPPIAFAPEDGLVHWYVERGDVRFPSADRLTFCHGYDCLFRATVRMTDDDLAELKAIFAPRAATAAGEREAINLAVSWFEKRAQPLLGGAPDVRGSDYAHSGLPGQTDCLDEATNSTTILVYLQEVGLLRHHRVIRPTSRGGLLVTLAHATAVFVDRDGTSWVVDSWMRDMGDVNDVMPLSEWESHLF